MQDDIQSKADRVRAIREIQAILRELLSNEDSDKKEVDEDKYDEDWFNGAD